MAVFPDLASIRRECEAIDVEEGAYHFFDNLGRRLIPRFTTSVSRSRSLFGVSLVGGGNFELDLDPEDQSAFETAIANAVGLEPNRWFATIHDLSRYVAENRERENEM